MIKLPATLLRTSQPSGSPANEDKPTGCITCCTHHMFNHSHILDTIVIHAVQNANPTDRDRWCDLNSSRPRSSRLRFGMWHRVVWLLVAIFRKSATLKMQAECSSATPALTRLHCVTPQSNIVNNLVFAVSLTLQHVAIPSVLVASPPCCYLIATVLLWLCSQTRPYALYGVLRTSWPLHWRQVLTLSRRLVFSAGDVSAFAVNCQCGN